MTQASNVRARNSTLGRAKARPASGMRDIKGNGLPEEKEKVFAGRPSLANSKKRNVLTALMDATNHCLEETDASRLTVRQIADAAHVNQAMIHYYFENKEGLLSSVNEQGMIDLARSLDRFLKNVEEKKEAKCSLEDLIELIEDYFANNRGLYLIDVRGDIDYNCEMHKKYSSGLGGRSYTRISSIIVELQKQGKCRSDIPSNEAAYIICAYCGFPALINPGFLKLAFRSGVDGEHRAARRKVIVQLLTLPAG